MILHLALKKVLQRTRLYQSIQYSDFTASTSWTQYLVHIKCKKLVTTESADVKVTTLSSHQYDLSTSAL
jgi:hypothetical protein